MMIHVIRVALTRDGRWGIEEKASTPAILGVYPNNLYDHPLDEHARRVQNAMFDKVLEVQGADYDRWFKNAQVSPVMHC